MKRIAFCDLEGTLIKGRAWEHIRDKFGAKELSDEYDKLYEEGKVGFEEWRRELVKIWKENKVSKQQFVDELKDYELLPSARELILGLKEKGFKVIVVTGAISVLAEIVKEDLGIDEVYSGHEFIFDENGKFLDIKTHEEYGRGEGKVGFIKKIIEKEDAAMGECIAVGGDDINDYWMMKELDSFAVKPHLRQIKEVVNHEVNELIEILEFV
jgi:HAD superfamily phosphoserine phosphatase-like hydrolase